MAAKTGDVVIKKYANRRLYNTGTSTYVTLEDLAEMVKRNEDITHSVLTQIIFELENKDGQNMLPIPFLRQLIAYYGDQMQVVLPTFLEQSMSAFAKEQERMREQLSAAFGKSPIDMMNISAPVKLVEEQVRRNTEMLQHAMRMFTPFPLNKTAGAAEADETPAADTAKKDTGLDELKEQIAAMQRKLDSLDK